MKVAFRVDSSIAIGSGHLIRCLTLAISIRNRGNQILFVTRDLPGNSSALIERGGFPLHLLPKDNEYSWEDINIARHGIWPASAQEGDALHTREAFCQWEQLDWLVVDHYGLSRPWETSMRPMTRGILVIDDLADRPHDCDILLDQNLHDEPETRYQGLAPLHCRMFLGPKYALLRDEFHDMRKGYKPRDGIIRRVIVFFGGMDSTNETGKALEAIRLLNRPDILFDMVVGSTNPQGEHIKILCSGIPNVSYHCQVENMAQLMAQTDLALGAGGISTWERCVLGLPSITVVVAGNQAPGTISVARAGATWFLGNARDVTTRDIQRAMEAALSSPEELREMSRRALEIMGGDDYLGKDSLIETLMDYSDASAL